MITTAAITYIFFLNVWISIPSSLSGLQPGAKIQNEAWKGRCECLLWRASWPLHPLVEPCPKIRAWPLMSPWERARSGFRPSQHLWKCSCVTTTKSTCQRPARWTSSPRLHRLQLPQAPNELVWMSICLLQWKGKMRYGERVGGR